jgi:hypothetical protein
VRLAVENVSCDSQNSGKLNREHWKGLMQIYPLKLGVPFVLMGLPFSYLIVTSENQAPWLAAAAAYFLLSFLLMTWFAPFAYRVSALTIWGRFLLNACLALAVAPVYALVAYESLDGLFVARPP